MSSPRYLELEWAIDGIKSAIQHLREARYDYDVIDILENIANELGEEE